MITVNKSAVCDVHIYHDNLRVKGPRFVAVQCHKLVYVQIQNDPLASQGR